MARSKQNDVELIISAKNESEKAFKSVTDALKEIETASKKSGGLKTLFQGFEERVAAAATAQRQFNDLISDTKAVQKAIDSAGRFTKVVETQEKALAEANGRLAELESGYADLERAANAAREPNERLIKTLSDQTGRQESLGQSIAETRREIERANSALAQNAGLDERAAAAVNKQRAAVIGAGQAWRETTQAITVARNQLANLASQRNSVQAALTGAVNNRSGLEAELQTLKEFLREAKRLDREVGLGEAAKRLADNAATRLQEVQAALKSERQLQASLSNDLSKTTAAIRRQEQALDKLTSRASGQKKAYTDLKNALGQFEAAARAEGTDRQQKNIDRLNASLERLQTNYAETAARVSAAGAAIAKASSPDPRAVAQFDALRKKIDDARQAVVAEQAELDRLNKELRDAGISTETLAQRQRELDQVTERLTAEEARLTQELKEMGTQAGRTGQRVKETSNSFLQLGRDTRQSLSYLQRIRGELLSIAATYTGVFAVGGAIRSIYDASVQLNKAQARFSVFFDGDAQKVADEIKFVTETANGLKIEVEGTLNQYSKFVSGLDQSQIPLEQIRKTFVGFATAGRVGRLSAEELERVFNALSQIFGKQQLQTEELKGQLADALPGAVKRTADALKLGENGVAELTKAMEDGNVTSEAAILLANELYKVYGSQLPTAMKGPDAAFADFKNTLFDLRVELANSGFIETLTQGLNEVTEALKSEEFKRGAKSFAEGLATIVKLGVSLVQNYDKVAKVLAIVFGAKILVAVNDFRNGIVSAGLGIAAFGKELSKQIGPLGRFTAGLGAMLARLASLPVILSAIAGFSFGKWLSDSFPEVQKFGVALIAGFEKLRIQLSAVWKKLKSDFTGTLKAMSADAVNFALDVASTIGKAIGAEDAADVYSKLKIEAPENSVLTDINKETEEELKRLDATIEQMFADIDAKFKDNAVGSKLIDPAQVNKDIENARNQVNSLFSDAEESDLLAKAFRNQGGKNAEQLEKLRQRIRDALQTIDTEIQQKSGDTLEQRLEAIRGEYAKLLRQIEQAGGASQFPGAAASIDQIVAIKQVEETEKEINNLIQERRTLVAAINEQAELGAITVEEATKRINDENARLIPQMTDALQKARDISAQINSAPISQSVNAQAEIVSLEQLRAKKEQLVVLEEQINRAMQLRSERIQTINAQVDVGLLTETEGRRQILDINRQTKLELDAIVARAMQMAQTLGDQELIERLKQVNIELANVNEQIITAAQFNEQFTSGLTNAIDGFIQGTQSASDALRSFFADMLRWLARAILQWTILKAIQNSGTGGAIAGLVNAGVNHTGGVVGKTASRRQVPIAAFAGAVRYHSGGVAGLKPNEMPTILEKGEEVLTANDPRHVANGGGSGSGPMQVKIVNTIDSASFLNEALATSAGQKAIVNAVKAQKSSIKSVLS